MLVAAEVAAFNGEVSGDGSLFAGSQPQKGAIVSNS